MNIKYTHSHINDPEGTHCESSLTEFILKIPDLGLTIRKVKVIPPLSVINEFLSKGESDSGMSGSFTWEPLKIEASDYDSITESFKTTLGDDAFMFEDEAVSLTKWMSMARTHYKKQTK